MPTLERMRPIELASLIDIERSLKLRRINAASNLEPLTLKPLQTEQNDLYRGLVGHAWANLGEPVRRLHRGALQGTGRFTVRHGERKAARLLARLLRLPAPGIDVPVQLVVTTRAGGGRERWDRTFGAGTSFVTQQSAGASGQLVEQIGPTEIRYRLEVAGGALYYRQAGASLRLGPIRLPLPRWLAPRIAARESAMPDEKSTHISVEVAHPLLGRLISYKGYLVIDDQT